ncbi:beta-4c adrenergic receptor [Plakobranchus ocellatus]|uniref:Beta-4c adrenergic receptor n=1 Tax=Plakobranchus ocellatus TaxID=259542 RepID=A0AAV4BPT2_9GAST|nr:beta-4c adrenergic receptor [Plakobranchus ocellatus]
MISGNMNSSIINNITDLQLTTTSLVLDSCVNEDLDSSDAPGFVAVLMGVVMLCENLLLIIVIGRTKSLHSHTNILVASLAISDVLVGVEMCVMGLYVLPRGLRSWLGLNQAHTRVIDTILTGINFSLVAVSMSHFAVLAVDRYLYVLWPLHYSLRVTQRRIVAVAAVLWIFGLIYMVLPVVLYTAPRYHVTCFLFNSPVEYGEGPLLIVYLLCICVVLASTIGLAKIALKHRRRKQKRLLGRAKKMSPGRFVNDSEQTVKCASEDANSKTEDCNEAYIYNISFDGDGSKTMETANPLTNSPIDFTSARILNDAIQTVAIDKGLNPAIWCLDVHETVDSGAEFKLSKVGTEDRTNRGFNGRPGKSLRSHANTETYELYTQSAYPVFDIHDVRAKNELIWVSEQKVIFSHNQTAESENYENNLNSLSFPFVKSCTPYPSPIPKNSAPSRVTEITCSIGETPTNIFDTLSSTENVDHWNSGLLTENLVLPLKMAKDTNESTKQAASKRLFSKENIKIIKFVAVMFGCFLVCTLPPLLIFFLDELPGGPDFSDKVIGPLFIMLASNSGMNFLIFTYMNKDFREALLQYFSCRKLKR